MIRMDPDPDDPIRIRMDPDPEETTITGGGIPQPVGLDTGQDTGASLRAPPPQDEPALPEDFGDVDDYVDMPKKKGGIGKILVILALILFLLGALVVLVLVILGVGYVSVQDAGEGTSTGTGVEAPVNGDGPVKDASGPELPDGHKINNPGKPSKSKSRSTRLSTTAKDGALVKVTNVVTGFDAVWDGKGEWDLGALPAGKYKSAIQPLEGKKHRARYFTIVARKKCDFKYDLDKKAWEGSCK